MQAINMKAYMTMLAVLNLSEDETTFIKIAKKLGTTKKNVTQLVKNLEWKEFVSIVTSKKHKKMANNYLGLKK